LFQVRKFETNNKEEGAQMSTTMERIASLEEQMANVNSCIVRMSEALILVNQTLRMSVGLDLETAREKESV
jgi:hypothetical protein